jgi:hypothetical protein
MNRARRILAMVGLAAALFAVFHVAAPFAACGSALTALNDRERVSGGYLEELAFGPDAVRRPGAPGGPTECAEQAKTRMATGGIAMALVLVFSGAGYAILRDEAAEKVDELV